MEIKEKLFYSILNWHISNNAIHFFASKKHLISSKDNNNNASEPLSNTDIEKYEINEQKSIKIMANSLKELKYEVENLQGCTLKKTATNLVFSDGNSNAKVMLIGEAPGEEEDKTGKPFQGKAGVLMDKMLNAIGQNRNNTYITNVVFWRPPGNRNPSDEEISICMPFVLKHIELVNPKILILAGAVATRAILKEKEGIIQLRGKWKNFMTSTSSNIRVMPIFHPAFLLRQPTRKREAWEDLKKIKKEIDLIT